MQEGNCKQSDKPKQHKKKLDRVLKKLGLTNVQCVRIYDTELMKLIISSRERGEEPQILVLKTFNEKRGEEIQLIFLGKHHVEDLSYFTLNPKKWNSKRFGYSVLTLEQAVEFGEILSQVRQEFGQLKEPEVKMQIEAKEQTPFPFQVYCWQIVDV